MIAARSVATQIEKASRSTSHIQSRRQMRTRLRASHVALDFHHHHLMVIPQHILGFASTANFSALSRIFPGRRPRSPCQIRSRLLLQAASCNCCERARDRRRAQLRTSLRRMDVEDFSDAESGSRKRRGLEERFERSRKTDTYVYLPFLLHVAHSSYGCTERKLEHFGCTPATHNGDLKETARSLV